MRIVFLIATLGTGGGERVAVTLCNAWAKAGHDVHLLSWQGREDAPGYALDSRLHYHPLSLLKESRSLWQSLRNSYSRVAAVRAALKEISPDILVCFMAQTSITGILASRGLRGKRGKGALPVVISERTHPGFCPLSRLHHVACRIFYPLATRLVVQTAEISAFCKKRYLRKSSPEPCVIPNPLDLSLYNAGDRPQNGERRSLLTVGRLGPEKGHDRLIRAFASVANRYPDWDLHILGDGDMRQMLLAEIKGLNLEQRVFLHGVVTDVPDRLRRADAYVHAALFEGFPNAVIEALASGLPVLAADCPGAIREILGGGTYGLLARPDDVEDLAGKLDQLLGDADLRTTLGARARDAVSGLDPGEISTRWIDLFQSCQSEGN